ncbi:hypothetical protein [Pararhizobium mangrovi]|uniref:Uncharacterized protein n=1 Tax=Pararhizobium mangrovi TaxID=2590452 RepID=A0A506U2N7_9HYPH|nr:hypothetical protein [Pararhizobium mangrovi]TPW26839.1 hypothetical protein FJU11_13620 [Pararhizobium mangrovi]
MTSETVEKCAKPRCGAMRRIGKPCTDWDCPQQTVNAREHRQILEAARQDIRREVIEEVANSLDHEADVTPCAEDAVVVRDCARLVRAGFSYDEAEGRGR